MPAYSAAVAGHGLRAAAILSAFVIVAGLAARLAEGESLAEMLRHSMLADAVLLGAFVLLGEAVRGRRAWAEEVRSRLRRAEEDREREAARRVAEERLRIAREMHDVLAHTIAAINVQAGVGADVIDETPERARASLRTIGEQSRAAMAELRATVGVLREDARQAPRTPAPGLAELPGLAEMAGGAGVRVEVAVAGTRRRLPVAVELTAYRIAQESLTNVVRHADASLAIGERPLRPGRDRARDQGRRPRASERRSRRKRRHGLIGMRERAASIGGTLRAGAVPGGGFRVLARLPTPRGSA